MLFFTVLIVELLEIEDYGTLHTIKNKHDCNKNNQTTTNRNNIITMDAVSDTSSIDIETVIEGGDGGRRISIGERDDNDNDEGTDDDDVNDGEEEETEEGNDDEAEGEDDTGNNSGDYDLLWPLPPDRDDDNDDDDSSGEEEPIPTPEEVELEYTYPKDFVGIQSWADFWRFARGHYFRLIIHSSCTKIADEFFSQCKYKK